jgi:hypothetical protein
MQIWIGHYQLGTYQPRIIDFIAEIRGVNKEFFDYLKKNLKNDKEVTQYYLHLADIIRKYILQDF